MIKNVIEYFEGTIKEYPNKIAVIDGDRHISFAEIADMSLSIGTAIQNIDNQLKKTPIAVFLPKSVESIVSDIGIIYSGNAYMNLDVKTPLQRIGNILELVKPAFVITNNKLVAQLSTIIDEKRILLIEEILEATSNHDLLLQKLEVIIDTDPLCLINTSGSTGTPKSVVLNHRSFIDFTEWAIDTMNWREQEIIGSLSPAVFDIYSFELCMLMAKSNTMVVIPENFAAFPAKILQLIDELKISYLFWVPTIMVNIANMGLLDRFDLFSLEMIWFAGEVFPTKQFNQWRCKLSKTKFVNMYGPIEITLDCTYYVVERDIPDDEPIPIGFPCRNTDILILDEDDNLITDSGVEGELCVRGTSLAMGYYNNPEKTASVFVQNPLNKSYPELIYRTGDIVAINERKEIVFKGRKDSLIKHYGYRIELSEIEHVIVNTLALVKNACAVYDYKHKQIVFFYESIVDISVAEFRKKIGTALPSYMIPNKYVRLQLLPRNTNGKVDRLALKDGFSYDDTK